MAEERAGETVSVRDLRSERGTALVVVLVAIVVLLPPTLILMRLSLRWQRQSLDFRDTIADEFHAEAGFDHARGRVADGGAGLAPGESTSFVVEGDSGVGAVVRIERSTDVVLDRAGTIYESSDTGRIDVSAVEVDADGRFVYRFRPLEIFVVEVEVARRPTLPATRLRGVLARLPEGRVETLGVTLSRSYPDLRRAEKPYEDAGE